MNSNKERHFHLFSSSSHIQKKFNEPGKSDKEKNTSIKIQQNWECELRSTFEKFVAKFVHQRPIAF